MSRRSYKNQASKEGSQEIIGGWGTQGKDLGQKSLAKEN